MLRWIWLVPPQIVSEREKKNVDIDYRPVHTYTMSNEVKYIEPKARVY